MYEEIHVGGKGPRAMAVLPVGPAAGAIQPQSPARTQSTSPHPTRRTPAQRAGQAQFTPRKRLAAASQPPTAAGSVLIHLLILGWVGLLAWGLWAGRLPWWVLGAAIGVNLLTFLVYAMDKSAAQNSQWRTNESHLHLLSLAGGWPGAWFAQQWLRHKSRKAEFRAVYWATVVLHCAAVVAWLGGWLRGL